MADTIDNDDVKDPIEDVLDEVPENISQNDQPLGIEEIMHTSYLRYSLSVNVGRAIPDVRDGMKPGMRRILFAMKQLGLTKSHAYVKCAKVVGETIANYHPHGDQAVYDTMVRMAQDFSMRAPLIDGQGNFGSIDGDAAAAYRYTECRMERVAGELLQDIDKNTVDMVPNFDETVLEPTVLPARFPNLLVNGSSGIGVGMATNIPPHNLGEVIDATVMLIDNPKATVEEMITVLPGPDFPTGGEICGITGIRDLYETGHGSITLRGKVRTEVDKKSGRERLIITEIPYAVNKESMVEKIADLVNDKIIDGISGLADESSSRAGIRVVIDLKMDADANVVLNQLYKHTPLQMAIGCHFLVVDRNRPRVLGLRGLLQAYIDHRLEVIIRRTRFDLEKAEDRDHILQGFLIAVKNLDDVVAIIRNSRTRDEAAERLIAKYSLSPKQTAAILEMRLHQLTGLAIDEITAEHNNLVILIAQYKELLASREKLMAVVKAELLEVRDRYADKRRTKISMLSGHMNLEDFIAKAVWMVTVSDRGYVNRIREDEYRTQGRGGVGFRGVRTKEQDRITLLSTAKSHDFVLFITNFGKIYALKAYEIPEGGRDRAGKPVVNFLRIEDGEKICAILSLPALDTEGLFLFMATRNGVIKKTPLIAYKNLRRGDRSLLGASGGRNEDNRFGGIRAINLDEGDNLISAVITDGTKHVLLSSVAGRACRFKETDVRTVGRVARGVRGMNLNAPGTKDRATEVVAMTIVDENSEVLVITAKGMGKRSKMGTGISTTDEANGIKGYRLTKRGGRGVLSIRLGDDDRVVSVIPIHGEDEDILIMSLRGQTVRIETSTVRTIGRVSKGVRVMKLGRSDEVLSVSTFAKLTEEELKELGIETALVEAIPEDEGAADDDLADDVGEEEEGDEDAAEDTGDEK
jgi:DNA gyrase subunit A